MISCLFLLIFKNEKKKNFFGQVLPRGNRKASSNTEEFEKRKKRIRMKMKGILNIEKKHRVVSYRVTRYKNYNKKRLCQK